MNNSQNIVFEILISILKTKNIEKYYQESIIRYGILNYVAKYSLARDTYFVTEKSLYHLEKGGFLESGSLRRGAKNMKNGFTYEHPIPSKVIADIIMMDPTNEHWVKDVLISTDLVTVLTHAEEELLRGRLKAGMPEGWKFRYGEVFQRYIDTGISKFPLEKTIPVIGTVKR